MSKPFIVAAAAVALACAAQAQVRQPTPQSQFALDKQEATSRYESDKALCKDEATTKARLDCRREAKAQYDAAIAAAKGRLAAATGTTAPVAAPAVCADCGHVVDVAMKEEAGQGSPVGMIAGGVGGALLGRQIGGGTGRDVATIAGAVGGAYAGKKIEEKVTAKKVWTVTVDYPNNIKRSFRFEQDPGFKVGDPVRSSGSSIVRQ